MSSLSFARQRVLPRAFTVASRRWLVPLALLLSSGLGLPAAAADQPPKVLLVVSGEGRLDAAAKQQRPGFEMDELAQAWLVQRANGLRVEVASPTGGAPVADRYNNADDSIHAFKADPTAVAALRAPRRTQDVSRGEHAAIFVIGGKGAMFDPPSDRALATLLGAHHAGGGVLAAVCWRRALRKIAVLLPRDEQPDHCSGCATRAWPSRCTPAKPTRPSACWRPPAWAHGALAMVCAWSTRCTTPGNGT